MRLSFIHGFAISHHVSPKTLGVHKLKQYTLPNRSPALQQHTPSISAYSSSCISTTVFFHWRAGTLRLNKMSISRYERPFISGR